MLNIKLKVLGLILNDEGSILLIKEKVSGKDQALWNAIRGTYDNGAESLEETMLRECREEASAEVTITQALPYHFERYNEDKIRVYFPFLCKLKEGEVQIQDEAFQKELNEEIVELRWCTKSQFEEMQPSEFMEPFIHSIIQKYFI